MTRWSMERHALVERPAIAPIPIERHGLANAPSSIGAFARALEIEGCVVYLERLGSLDRFGASDGTQRYFLGDSAPRSVHSPNRWHDGEVGLARLLAASAIRSSSQTGRISPPPPAPRVALDDDQDR
eukprot:CAMPEP_0180414974 /NCGR_PEP_ID=MMETSP0989-20121125/45948_1 /TAXON_ID=697907 /ORGANISM="non described non described, Strain CCMP2293" /LENGTH=126 /DNA_ID=CAMNT_0022419719 /DNA_START=233 /DNA_END=610 /DNA_ORIENTATION=-